MAFDEMRHDDGEVRPAYAEVARWLQHVTSAQLERRRAEAELFYRRGGVMDFSCATCHADEGKRIRLQGLPNLSKPGKQPQETMGTWPTYRVSQGALRTMQHRLWDCYRQQRWPVPEYGSDSITALTVFLQKQAMGGDLVVDSAPGQGVRFLVKFPQGDLGAA